MRRATGVASSSSPSISVSPGVVAFVCNPIVMSCKREDPANTFNSPEVLELSVVFPVRAVSIDWCLACFLAEAVTDLAGEFEKANKISAASSFESESCEAAFFPFWPSGPSSDDRRIAAFLSLGADSSDGPSLEVCVGLTEKTSPSVDGIGAGNWLCDGTRRNGSGRRVTGGAKAPWTSASTMTGDNTLGGKSVGTFRAICSSGGAELGRKGTLPGSLDGI